MGKRNRVRGVGFGWKFWQLNKPSNIISARDHKDGAEAIIKYSYSEIIMLFQKNVRLFNHT